eukprot:7865818-Alexandrium_andersonii.AAC.1
MEAELVKADAADGPKYSPKALRASLVLADEDNVKGVVSWVGEDKLSIPSLETDRNFVLSHAQALKVEADALLDHWRRR